MKEPSAPSLDELLYELEMISPIDTDGKTLLEWREYWNIGEPRARKIIHHALRIGRMKTQAVHRPDICRPGRNVQVWLHSFVSQPKKKRKK